MNYSVKKTLSSCKGKIANHPSSDTFFNYQFLSNLQKSGCVGKDTGWDPKYFVHQNDSVIPFYEKHNSQGEFVFDYSWANAYFRYGMRYYPKIVLSVPFTPVVGNRIFCDDNGSGSVALAEFKKFIDKEDFSSIHALYVSNDQREIFKENGFIERFDCNFKWKNDQYDTFDDYLGKLKSRYRKNIQKERGSIVSEGITFNLIEKPSQEIWEEFYLFYALTYVRRGQQPYLNLNFFKQIKESGTSILFAELGGEKIAAALFFLSEDTLYGRYWGAKVDIDFLHFETCYYQGIDLAIQKKAKFFDPGIQGQHKLKRGFEPVLNRSFHWIKNEEFKKAITNFCVEEAQHINKYYLGAKKSLPFKNE